MMMRKYVCDTCYFIYDENHGDSKNGVPRNTPIDKLCNSLCNRCQMSNLNRYSVFFPEYRNLEARFYSMFSGKWHIDFFLFYVNKYPIEISQILEVGTGLGRVTYPLVSHNFSVTGIENNPYFINSLLSQRWTKESNFTLIESDVYSLDIDKKFDCILIADSTFQELIYQKSCEEIISHLSNFLSPKGFIWIETVKSLKNIRDFRKKNIDLTREICLDSHIQVSHDCFSYHHTFELFNEGISQERSHVSRTLANVSKNLLIKELPKTLQVYDHFSFPKEGKVSGNRGLSLWTDGGYPLSTSNQIAEKEIYILKFKGE